jgi:hypothetical protein
LANPGIQEAPVVRICCKNQLYFQSKISFTYILLKFHRKYPDLCSVLDIGDGYAKNWVILEIIGKR